MLENRTRLAVLIVILAIALVAGTAAALKSFLDKPAAPQQTRNTYYGYGAPGAASGPGGGPGGGCGGSCCRTPGYGQVEETKVETVRKLAASYYSATSGDTTFEVEVRDFGCHQEAYIIKDGKQVKRLSISGGNVYEI